MSFPSKDYKKKSTPIIFGIILIATLWACAGESTTITEKEYGENWPFTVSSGSLECRRAHDVVLVSDGKVYALNGKARGNKSYRDFNEIWRDNPEFPGSKVPLGDIISRGSELCGK